MVICLERGADLHMAQLMPLPLTVSCFSKILIGFTFLVLAHPGSPGKRAIKQVCDMRVSLFDTGISSVQMYFLLTFPRSCLMTSCLFLSDLISVRWSEPVFTVLLWDVG